MLKSFVNPPALNEKIVTVRILKPIFVGGEAREVGSSCSMSLSDAQALRASTPPTVEIL